jgi:hypothetical protein
MRRVRGPARRELVAVAAVFVACALGLTLLHARSGRHYRLTAASAIAAARSYRGDREFLAKNATNGVRVIPLAGELQNVTFFDGPRVVLEAAVGPRGEVRSTQEHLAGAPLAGAAVANSPWMLALLSALFLLATMVVPLRRLRNLDALVLASLTATVVLLNEGLVGASVACASLGLAYLMIRCLVVGLRACDSPTPASSPLLSHLCAGWEPHRRVRLLRALVLATTLAFAMITLTSGGYTDVASASLEGATELLHGVLPYGHIQLAPHGDTYPLLNYVLYVPGALWRPVTTAFSDLSGSLTVALLASLLTGAALYRIGAGAQIAPGSGEPREERRLRLTLAWFAFAPALLDASCGANNVLVAACLAWMLALRTRAGASLLALAMAVWVKLAPLVLVAIWIPYSRRELVRSSTAAVALSLALTGLLVALGGPGAVAAMVNSMSFQFERSSFFAPWYTFGVQWLQPLVQAGVLALVASAALRLRADSSIRGDLVRLGALGAALLLGVQLSANYWTWSYLPWVFPLLAVALFAPSSAPVPALAIGTGSPTSAGQAPGPPAASLAGATATRPRPRLRGRRRSPSGAAAGR